MQVHFITPTKISLIDITSMGDSSKRDDPNTLGTFDSGLKYAIALLLRSYVDLSIEVVGGDKFTFSTYMEKCEATGKTKELIKVILNDELEVQTGFAKALGFNWELWMSLREIYSNMLDEKGYYIEGELPSGIQEGTITTLEFDEDNEFYEVWQNRHLYINEEEPLFKISPKTEVLENKEGFIRIYKHNILVYEDRETPSLYAYNIKFGEIDERRILSNVYSIKSSIVSDIMCTNNREYLETIIKAESPFDEEKEFLNGMSNYMSATNLITEIAESVYNEFGSVDSYDWLIKAVKERKDCKLPGRVIKSIEDSLWTYSERVTVESTPVAAYPLTPDECFEKSPLQKEIDKFYNFKVDVEVKTAELKGSKAIADKYEKCIIIDKDFSVEKDMPEFIVQYVDLTTEGNVVTNLSIYICNLIKK